MQKSDRFYELIRLQQDSGLSVSEFCRNEKINPSTFYYWRNKYEGKEKKKEFIPLIVKPTVEASANTSSSEVINSGSANCFELVYPNGTVLRLNANFDLQQLRILIHLYD